jgi:benzoyl-CoA-dihydrodiol lyase
MAADPDRKLSNGKRRIDFQTEPGSYRHWRREVDGQTATLLLDVDEKAALFEGYELKLNSYDLGVDMSCRCDRAAALPGIGGRVILCAPASRACFCAGANIMLAGATHAHKVNFCKFIMDQERHRGCQLSGLATICVINGTAAAVVRARAGGRPHHADR